MKKVTASVATVVALAVAVPAFAGGAHCGGDKSSATAADFAITADSKGSCVGKGKTAAWAGAWLQRSESGAVTVADVAKGSPAARSGLKAGDVVLAVNGYDLSDAEDRATCASKAECRVGSAVTYKVQRGSSVKNIRFKLEKMPANATSRYASREASYDPALHTVVMLTVN